MDTEYTAVNADAEVVGLMAYSALALMTRLDKDGDQAPTIAAHIEHARMSARAFTMFEKLEAWASERGIDVHAAAAQYSGMYDDLDARTRPTTWFERSVKTYVTVGIMGDLLLEVLQRHQVFSEGDFAWDINHAEWVRQFLAPQTAEDAQLAARLSLWARRVAGEALGLMRATLFTHPALVANPDVADAIAAEVIRRHGERMEHINLKA